MNHEAIGRRTLVHCRRAAWRTEPVGWGGAKVPNKVPGKAKPSELIIAERGGRAVDCCWEDHGNSPLSAFSTAKLKSSLYMATKRPGSNGCVHSPSVLWSISRRTKGDADVSLVRAFAPVSNRSHWT